MMSIRGHFMRGGCKEIKRGLDSFSMGNSVASITAYPEKLRAEGREILGQGLSGSVPSTVVIPAEEREIIEKVLPFSSFARTLVRTRPAYLFELLAKGLLHRSLSTRELRGMARDHCLGAVDEEAFLKRIRVFRNMHMLRIAIRDIGGISPFSETCRDLSALASSCLEIALRWTECSMAPRFGRPCGHLGENVSLIVLGMGKLGAGELNFSSDIDLMFSYALNGETTGGEEKMSNGEYFLYECRRLISILSKTTPHGLVFRVDTRLRPFGDSGPLVMPMDAMVEYYETHGRQWERYALVKASPVAGDIVCGRRLLELLRPFVYRKYIDYSTVEALKEMKAMILSEQEGKDISSNVKLGPGGIRDIEFVVQAFQLAKGGRIRALQVQSLLDALWVIRKLGLLEEETSQELTLAYVFLRTVENRLQEYDDRQVQCLPRDNNRKNRLALSLGYADYAGFYKDYLLHTGNARRVFRGLFHDPWRGTGKDNDSERRRVKLNATFVWCHPGDSMATKILRELGFHASAEVGRLIQGFRESGKVRCLTGRVQELLDRLLPRLLIASSNTKDPDKAFEAGLAIFEAVLKRSIYLVLLDQNPAALEHLVFLCSRSKLIGDLIRRQPILLDELVSGELLFRGLEKKELKELLFTILSTLTRSDLEHWMDELRRFKKAQVLRIGATELKGIIEASQVGRELSGLAEIILEEAFRGSWHDLLRNAPDMVRASNPLINGGLAVIAYGKLGSREMSYSSDLDLVFLYHPGRFRVSATSLMAELGYFYSRCIQRLIFFLSARTAHGILYKIDTRLRPNGSQGILVSTLPGFKEYQREKAWTWEHQAIIKARFICGDLECGQDFEKIRTSVICRKRNTPDLKYDISNMRSKLVSTLCKEHDKGRFHVKRSPGGLVDIEFIVQYLVLREAWKERSLADFRDTCSLINAIRDAGILGKEEAGRLLMALTRYQEVMNLKALDLEEPVVPLEELDELRRGVLETWDKVFG